MPCLYCSNFLLPCWSSALFIYPLLKLGIEAYCVYCCTIYSFLPSCQVCFMNFGVLLLGVYMFNLLIVLDRLILLSSFDPFIIFWSFYHFKVDLIFSNNFVSTILASKEAHKIYNACVPSKSPQSCPTLWDRMGCSPPGFSVHRILQARILEKVSMSTSRGSSWPRDGTYISYISCINRQVFYH